MFFFLFLNQDNERFKKDMKKKFQIGGGGAPVGAGTALDPKRVIDPKTCISICNMHYYLKSGSLKNRQKIEADHAELLMGSIDGKSHVVDR